MNAKKSFIFPLWLLTLVLTPIFMTVRADGNGWEPIVSTAAWTYEDIRVELLSFDEDVLDLIDLDDQVVVTTRPDSCYTTSCSSVNAYLLRYGQSVFLGELPADAVSAERMRINDGRLVYARTLDTSGALEGNHFAIYEIDLLEGNASVLIEDVFFSRSLQDVDVYVDDDDVYFAATFRVTDFGSDFHAGAVYVWDPYDTILEADIIAWHAAFRLETVEDIRDGVILSKFTFETGESELWLLDAREKTMEAIPDTWTPEDEIVTGAHFRTDGSIEFFRMFERYVYEDGVTTAQGDYLSWFKEEDEALQVVNGRMAWLDPDDTLYVSDLDGVIDLGTLGYPQEFRLTPDVLYFASGNEGTVYTFASGDTDAFPFVVTDSIDEAVVGLDADGSIWYMDTDSGNTLDLGFGEDPVLSDPDHVYWRGEDGGIYEATIMIGALSAEDIRVVMVEGDNTVYLVMDDTAHEIGSESVYFSWFDSWSDVETVSASELNEFEQGGEATYAAGSKLKLTGDPKVYVVGDDGKLHWLVTQTIAYDIYGSSWNEGIVEITQGDLTGLPYGTPILTESDIQSI